MTHPPTNHTHPRSMGKNAYSIRRSPDRVLLCLPQETHSHHRTDTRSNEVETPKIMSEITFAPSAKKKKGKNTLCWHQLRPPPCNSGHGASAESVQAGYGSTQTPNLVITAASGKSSVDGMIRNGVDRVHIVDATNLVPTAPAPAPAARVKKQGIPARKRPLQMYFNPHRPPTFRTRESLIVSTPSCDDT